MLAVGLMQETINHKYLGFSLLIYIFAAFSHEIAVFVLPFFTLIIYEATKNKRNVKYIGRLYIISFSMVSAVALFFSIIYHGDIKTVHGILDSLKNQGINKDIYSSGAIFYILNNVYDGMKLVASMFPGYFAYFPMLMLAISPLLLTNYWKGRVAFLLVGFISLSPIFVVAADWGRWIHIYIFMVFILLLFDSLNKHIEIINIPLFIVFVYCGFWSIPHYHAARIYFGIFEKALLFMSLHLN